MNGRVLTVGMACYRNWDEAWGTLEALRTYHGHGFDVVVVDNAPEPDGRLAATAAACEARYYHRPDLAGTSRPRAACFQFSRTPWTCVIDSHVLLEPGAVAALEEYARRHPGSRDIVSGPLVGDDGKWAATHWQPTTPPGLWGVWARHPDFAARWGTPEGNPAFDRAAGRAGVQRLAPFPVPMMGLGLWAMRTAAWPGFHPLFNGFGGEEGYIHEKVRRLGGVALCHPEVRWRHKFRDVGGWDKNPAPYPHNTADHVWNLLVGHRELGVAGAEAAIAKDFGSKIGDAAFAALRDKARAAVPEGVLELPPARQKILGVWYTNNGAPDRLLAASLRTIRAAAEQSRHDVRVVTCPWRPVPGNPFPEVLAADTSGNGHLNIVRQMRQCLGAAPAGWAPDAVSFLEHDVLYPPGYFDRVGDALARHPAAPVVSHQDYRGLNATGWLGVRERHEPMHQLTVRAGVVVPHLAACEDEARRTGQCLLEPQGDRAAWVRLPPDPGDRTPAVHVNHGAHLTSHGAVVFHPASAGPDGKPLTTHPFWGPHKDWWPGEVAKAAEPAPCGGCGGDRDAVAARTATAFPTLEAWYAAAAATPSDAHEHLPMVRALAGRCSHVTEVCSWGKPVRVALAAGVSGRGKFRSVAPAARPEWAALRRLMHPDEFEGAVLDPRAPEAVGETDLLFLDTKHTADETVALLEAHAAKARRYVVLHTTETFGERGDDGGPGVLPGLRLFLSRTPEWSVKEVEAKNHGLVVLSRLAEDRPAVEPGVVRLGLNYLAAKFTHWRKGRAFLPLPLAEERLAHCWTCKLRAGSQCSKCGCYLDVIDPEGKNPAVPAAERGKPGRAFYPDRDCPVGKWHAVDPETIPPAMYDEPAQTPAPAGRG